MKRTVALAFVLVGALPGWAQEKTPATASARSPGLYATLETSMGKIVVELYEKESPKTVANFVALATGKKPWRNLKSGQVVRGKSLYEGIIFHRVISNFMVQTGAHLPDGGARISNPIPDEFASGLSYDRPGRLGMANAGPNTGSSQFFITHVPVQRLDNKHTIFGQVVEGQDVVEKMAKVEMLPNEMGEQARPAQPITLLRVTIQRVGPPPVHPEPGSGAAPAQPAPRPQ